MYPDGEQCNREAADTELFGVLRRSDLVYETGDCLTATLIGRISSLKKIVTSWIWATEDSSAYEPPVRFVDRKKRDLLTCCDNRNLGTRYWIQRSAYCASPIIETLRQIGLKSLVAMMWMLQITSMS